MFDLSNITLAFKAQSEACEVFALMCADMLCWHHSGDYPANADIKAAITAARPDLKSGTLSTYASAILKWSRKGQTPASMNAMVNSDPKGHAKSTRGRKAKKVAETAATETTAKGFDLRTFKGCIGSVDGMLAGMAHWIATDKRDPVENAMRALRLALTAAKPEEK